MFPQENQERIVKELDEIEADLYRIYRKIERFRGRLQEQWKVLPSGDKWTPERHLLSLNHQ